MDKYITKTSYYVEYLGWKPVNGIQGRMYTEPIIRELMQRRKHADPPKITIQLNRKEMKVTRETIEDGKRRKIKCIKYPPIPTRDIVFAIQGLEPSCEVVACVFLGFNPRTRRYVHAHIYRFDSPKTAGNFVHYIQTIASVPENVKRMRKIEADLIRKGHIEQPQANFDRLHNVETSPSHGYYSEHSATDSNGSAPRDIEEDMVSLHEVLPFDSITDELKQRLTFGGAPLLLPPKDYDTISRARGNVDEATRRKCLNADIVGEGGASYRPISSHGSANEDDDKSSSAASDNASLNSPPSDSSPGVSNDPATSKPMVFKAPIDYDSMKHIPPGSPRYIEPPRPNHSGRTSPRFPASGPYPLPGHCNLHIHGSSSPTVPGAISPRSGPGTPLSEKPVSPLSGHSFRSVGSGSENSVDRGIDGRRSPFFRLPMSHVEHIDNNPNVKPHIMQNRNININNNVIKSQPAEPEADYDADDLPTLRVPPSTNDANAVQQQPPSNIFQHDFYRNNDYHQNRVSNGQDIYHRQSELVQQQTVPIHRVNSLYR